MDAFLTNRVCPTQEVRCPGPGPEKHGFRDRPGGMPPSRCLPRSLHDLAPGLQLPESAWAGTLNGPTRRLKTSESRVKTFGVGRPFESRGATEAFDSRGPGGPREGCGRNSSNELDRTLKQLGASRASRNPRCRARTSENCTARPRHSRNSVWKVRSCEARIGSIGPVSVSISQAEPKRAVIRARSTGGRFGTDPRTFSCSCSRPDGSPIANPRTR